MRTVLLPLALVLFMLGSTPSGWSQSQPEFSGSLLVKLKDPQKLPPGALGSSGGNTVYASASERYHALADAFAADYHFDSVKHFLERATIAAGVSSSRGISTTGDDSGAFLKVELPEGSSPEAVLAALNDDPRVAYAERESIRKLLVTPNDPNYVEQYAHSLTLVPSVWDTQTGVGVTVAIIDTGVDYTHPDLAENMLPGYDFVEDDSDPTDDDGHGTHCAGIAAARGNNGIGVAGVAWSAKILPVRVLTSHGGTDSDVAAGIRYAADQGAHVISMSLGGPYFSKTLLEAVRYAKSKDAVIVAAAGNAGTSEKVYPGAFDEVLAVAATDSEDRKAVFSTYGSWVDISAPGVRILSTMPKGSYNFLSGTSMATPYVAGAVALLRAQRPELVAEAIEGRVLIAGDDISQENPGMGGQLGGGRINVASLLSITPQNLFRLSGVEIFESAGNMDGMIQPGESHSIRMMVKNLGSDAVDVRATISSTSKFIAITDATSSFGNLVHGMASGNQGDPVLFSVTSSAPFGTVLGDILITLTSAGKVVLESVLTIKTGLPAVTGFPISLGDANVGSITIDDLEGNGSPEIIFGSTVGNLWVIEADGKNASGWPINISSTSSFAGIRNGISVGDITGDTIKEVVVGTVSNVINVQHPVYAFSALGKSLSGWPKKLSPGVYSWAWRNNVEYAATIPTLADMDSDGVLDVVFSEGLIDPTTTTSSKIYALNGDGRDVAGFPLAVDIHAAVDSLMLVTDIDGDGPPELALTSIYSELALYRNNGNTLSRSPIGERYEIRNRSLGLGSVDIFGDGKRRITSLGKVGASLIGPSGRQERGFTSVKGLPSDTSGIGASWEPSGGFNVPVWGDFDGDGYFEGVYSATGNLGGQTRLLVNSIDSTGAVKSGFPVAFGNRSDLNITGQVLVHDLDGDGAADFLIPFSSGIEAVSSKATRLPLWSFDFPAGCSPEKYSSPAIGDLNGDGTLEIVFACRANNRASLFALTLPASKAGTSRIWPMFQGDGRRSGGIPGAGKVPPTPTPGPSPTATPPRLVTQTPTPTPTATPTPRQSATPDPGTTPEVGATPTPSGDLGVSNDLPPSQSPVLKGRWLSSKKTSTRKNQSRVKVSLAVVNSSVPTLDAQANWKQGRAQVSRKMTLRRARIAKLKSGEIGYTATLSIAQGKNRVSRVTVSVPNIAVPPLKVRL